MLPEAAGAGPQESRRRVVFFSRCQLPLRWPQNCKSAATHGDTAEAGLLPFGGADCSLLDLLPMKLEVLGAVFNAQKGERYIPAPSVGGFMEDVFCEAIGKTDDETRVVRFM